MRYISYQKYSVVGAINVRAVLSIVLGILLASGSDALSQALGAKDGRSLPSFEVASIRPFLPASVSSPLSFDYPRFHASGIQLQDLIEWAFNIRDPQLTGEPDWVRSTRYDVTATFPENMRDMPRDQRQDQVRLMLQSLLGQRFHFRYHRSMRKGEVYWLVATSKSPRLLSLPPKASEPPTEGRYNILGEGRTMPSLAQILTFVVNKPVVDKTDITGAHDFEVRWSRNDDPTSLAVGSESESSSGLTIFDALKQELGLGLVLHSGQIETIVVESIAAPSPN